MWEGKRQGNREAFVSAEDISTLRATNDAVLGTAPLAKNVEVVDNPFDIPRTYFRYTGDDRREDKMLLYFHGGAFENGTIRSHYFITSHIADANKSESFSLDYTQWPECEHPVALNEAVACWNVLATAYGAENITIAGDSAGAVMCLVLCHWLNDHDRELPGKVIAVGPALDFGDGYESRVTREDRDPMLWGNLGKSIHYYWNVEDIRDPYVSPGFGDFSKFPPTFITVGTDEVLYDDAIDLHNKLDAAGVENTLIVCEGAFHVYVGVLCPEAFEAFEKMSTFLLG